MQNFRGNLNDSGLASFNQRLFDSQVCFNDAVWIIDLETEMVEILWDNIEPDTVGNCYSLEAIQARVKGRYPGRNKEIENRYSREFLRALKETVYFNNPSFVNKGRRFKLRQSLTPEINAEGITTRVYVTGINIQNFVTERSHSTEIYKTVSMILSHAKNHEQSIMDTLEYIGGALNVGRVYIFENDPDRPGYGSNTFEWCAEGVTPNKDQLQNISYVEYGFDQIFSNAQLYCCADVDEIGDQFMRELFKGQGIKAFINYAFYDNDHFAGFIGIDDNYITRPEWDSHSEEIEILTFVADLLMTYLIKERNLVHAVTSNEEAKQQSARSAEFLNMLETLAGSAPWYVYYNEDGSEREANWGQNLRSMLGYEDENDFPNKFSAWTGSIHPDERDEVVAACEDQLYEKGIFSVIYRAVRKDGSIILMKTEGTAKFYEDGTPRLYYGTIHDVTEEETLRRKEQENKVMMEHFIAAYTSAYTVDLKNRTFEILHMAHEFREVFTMNGNLEDMARFVEEHVHPDDRPTVRMMTDPDYVRSRLIEESSITFTLREQYHNEERIMHVIIMRTINPDNCAIGFMDVTAELQKEKEINEKLEAANVALQHDKEQARIIETLSNSFSSVYTIDVESSIYKRIYEREESALVFPERGSFVENFSKYVEHFMLPEFRNSFTIMMDEEQVNEKLADGNIYSMEYCREDDSWRRGFFLPSEYKEDGTLKSFLFAVQNIDEEKRNELQMRRALQDAYDAAQLASNAKTTFLSNMSHDIRTPMNAIIGMTAIAGAHLNEPDRIADCLKKITASGRHLLGLINQVLDMSKIESGKVDLNEEDFNLSELIDEVIGMNHAAGKAREHELNVIVDSLAHENVIGDRIRLEQVFNNLLSNAIKYTPNGGKIEIIIREKETNKSNIGWYEVVVRDNGIGMTEDFRKTIFEPFARAADSRAASKQGTGLGMPIARNIARMMNGDITVESRLNEGSTFTVSFSLRINEGKTLNYEHFLDIPVLVVDDDEPFCVCTCEMLDSLTLKSEYVTSGQDAVDRTVAHHEQDDDYYAIIMDWKMPGMDGVETTRQIRSRVGNDVPVIVLTSYDWSEIEEEAREAGVNAFLSKPLFKSKVIELFNELNIGKSHTAMELAEEDDVCDFTGKRILLAEDNELNREIALELLGVTGLAIDTAEDGSICVDTFTQTQKGYYDLIFMDIQMPNMNGYDAARAIRASSHPDGAEIPIIAMTANAFSTDVVAAMEAGMNGHISKPIDMSIVLKTLKEYLQ